MKNAFRERYFQIFSLTRSKICILYRTKRVLENFSVYTNMYITACNNDPATKVPPVKLCSEVLKQHVCGSISVDFDVFYRFLMKFLKTDHPRPQIEQNRISPNIQITETSIHLYHDPHSETFGDMIL